MLPCLLRHAGNTGVTRQLHEVVGCGSLAQCLTQAALYMRRTRRKLPLKENSPAFPIALSSPSAGAPATMRRAILRLVPAVRAQGTAARIGVQQLSYVQIRSFADDANLKKTALWDLHVQHGGMIGFCWFQSMERTHIQQPNHQRRQDGTFCRVVNAHSIQGLHHGLYHLVPRACFLVRCITYVRPHAEGKHELRD